MIGESCEIGPNSFIRDCDYRRRLSGTGLVAGVGRSWRVGRALVP